MPSEINIDELKALTREAQNAHKKKNQLEAEKIIDKIPMKARQAAREGKTSVVVHTSKGTDPVSEIVFDWCVKQGLNPTKEKDEIIILPEEYRDFARRLRDTMPKSTQRSVSIVIHW